MLAVAFLSESLDPCQSLRFLLTENLLFCLRESGDKTDSAMGSLQSNSDRICSGELKGRYLGNKSRKLL